MPIFNYEPSRVVFMDLETQSACNLKTEGVRPYLHDPTTRIMSAVFKIGGDIFTWVPSGVMPVGYSPDDLPGYFRSGPLPPDRVLNAIRNGATFVAHNAEMFDALIWEKFIPKEYQPTWIDTVHLARFGGYPAGLDRLARKFGFEGKDAQGSRAMKLLCNVIRGRYPVGTKPLWEDMLNYNVQDVILLEKIYHNLKQLGEPDLLPVHTEINARGIAVDIRLVRQLRELWAQYQEFQKEEAAETSQGGLSPNDLQSPAKVKSWLRTIGFEVSTLQRQAVEQMLADPEGYFGESDDPRVAQAVAVLSARADSIRSTVGKLARAETVVDQDGRARGLTVYYGAHTGRWSGRDLQPHNFPRGNPDLNIEAILSGPMTLLDIAERAKAVGCKPGDALATLTRPILCAPPGKVFAIADYAGIEARGTAWVCREAKALTIFADLARDIYCEMAGRIYGRAVTKKDKAERQVGKVVVLGCGYGMGVNKFDAYCKLQGIDLASAGVTAEQCVQAYRNEFSAIPAGWRALDKAAKGPVYYAFGVLPDRNNQPVSDRLTACRCSFYMEADALVCQLPSGRKLYYRDARIERLTPVWDRGGALVDTLTYESPHGYRKTLYGGLLCENVVQAICRDLLADALLQVGSVVLHVHDEIIVEADEQNGATALQNLALIMSIGSGWSAGFPIRVEGFTCPRYVKAPWSTSVKIDCINGQVHKLELPQCFKGCES